MIFSENFCKKIWRLQKNIVSLHRQIPLASHKNSVPSGTFLFYEGMKYTKQAITTAEQISILRQRGLIVEDESQAREALDVISYFRLADYWRYMEADHTTHQFKENCHFSEILDYYYFDKELKALLFSAIQTIEVAIRTKIIKHFTPTFGAFWFMDESLASNPDFFHSNLEHIRTEVKRSREEFITEHFLKYAEPDLPPVWKTLEVVSFGTLSKLFGNFKDATAKHQVAREFGLNHHKFLKSWMETLVALRNYCAHHSRVWNRRFPVKPQTPRRMPQDWISDFSFRQETIYPQLCCITYWLNSIYPKNTFVADFKAMLEKHPSVSTRLMGFPAHWEEEPLWK